MWWEPQTPEESRLRATIFRLSDYFLSERVGYELIHGIGSTIGFEGERVPWLLVERAFDPRRQEFVGGPAGSSPGLERIYDRFGPFPHLPEPQAPRGGTAVRVSTTARLLFALRWIVRSRLSPGRALRAGRRLRLVPISVAADPVAEVLRQWEVPSDSLLTYTSPPISLAGPGSETTLVSDSGKTGSIGLALDVAGRSLICSAGHFIDHEGAEVFLLRRRRLRRNLREPFGRVVLWNDPRSERMGPAGGVDIAVIETHRVGGRGSPASVALPASIRDQELCFLVGGVSGRRDGWVDGALQVTRSMDGRTWQNVWAVHERPGRGFAQRGDSGGVVFREPEDVMGHLVSAYGGDANRGRRQAGLVQDLETIVEYVQRELGKPVTVWRYFSE